MAVVTAKGQAPHYFVPEPSAYPALMAFGLFFVILGASQWSIGIAALVQCVDW
jgi:cytochrome c oxidase subunit III